MDSKFAASCIGVFTLLVGTVNCVTASGLEPGPPIIGDYAKASRLIMLGNNDLASNSFAAAKTEFEQAQKVCPFDADARLGLARCAMGLGNPQEAVRLYGQWNPATATDISLSAEYVLALQAAGDVPDAVINYNHALDLCRSGHGIKMDIYPRSFAEDGSDYNAAEMSAMTHLMMVVGMGYSDKRLDSELEKAGSLAPRSSIVYFYKGFFLQSSKKPGASQAFEQALTLDDGTNAKVIAKRMALSQN